MGHHSRRSDHGEPRRLPSGKAGAQLEALSYLGAVRRELEAILAGEIEPSYVRLAHCARTLLEAADIFALRGGARWYEGTRNGDADE